MIKSKISLTDAAEQRGSHVYWNRASKQIEQEQEGESVRLGLKFNNGIPKTTFIMYILGTAFGRSGDSRLAQIMVGCLSLRGAEKCGRHLDAASFPPPAATFGKALWIYMHFATTPRPAFHDKLMEVLYMEL